MHTISNKDSVIDSRDVIKRIEELQKELEERHSEESIEGTFEDWLEAKNDDDDVHEYNELKNLQEEAEGYSEDWPYGATLIHEDYFVDYCKELCEDIGDLPKNLPNYLEIDWEKTADNLKADYTEVSYGDATYLIR